VTEGSSVRIQGKGFHGNETLDIFVGEKYVANVTPNLYGSFSLDIMMPALAGGEQSITARGATTNNTASTTVTFTPALSVWPAWRMGIARARAVDSFGNILINETCLDPNPNATSYHVRRAKIDIDSENNIHIVFHGENVYEPWPDYTNRIELDAHEVFYLKINPYLDDMDGSAADYVNITVIPETIISKDDGNKSRAANVAIDSEDNVHVAWFDKDISNWANLEGELHYLVMNQTGGIVVSETNVTAGFLTNVYWSEPEIVVDSQGNAHIFFVTSGWTGSDGWRDIWYIMIDGNTGNVLINDTQLTDSNQTWRYSRPFVDIDSEEQIHIAWHDSRFYSNGTGEHEIFYMKIDPYLDNRNGTSADPEAIKIVDEMLISNNDYVKSYLANIAVDEHGIAHLVWINEWTSGSGDIYYAQVNATGDIIVPETRITYSKGILNFAEYYYSYNRNPEIAVADWRVFIVDMARDLSTNYYDVWLTIAFYDTAPPDIGTPTREPSGDVEEEQPVNILVNVTDMESGVQNVTLSYSTDGGENWTNVTMEKTTGNTYQGQIPGLPMGTHVQYQITAYDKIGNPAVEDKAGSYYVYTVIPEFPSFIVLPLFMLLALIAVAVHRIRRSITGKTT